MTTRQRPRSATVVLLAGAGLAIEPVIRDLAVAAYALRTRGVELDVLLLHGQAGDMAVAAAKAAAELDLPLAELAVPPGGEAYLAGFRHVVAQNRVDLIVTLDANGRHDPTHIPHLIDRLVAEDLDVVIGSRWAHGSGTPGLSPPRWILGRVANLAFRLITGTRGVTDATTTFRVARIRVVRDFSFAGAPLTHHSVQTAFVAMAIARGHAVGEYPIIYRPAVDPGGGLRGRDVLAFVRHLLALRRRVDRARQRRLSPAGRVFDDGHFGAAEDLERLGSARHFFDWVLDELDPYVHGRVLEVGAGLGTITRRLVERYPGIRLVALEPAANVFADLASFAALTPSVTAHRQTLVEYEDPEGGFDAVVYLNVLEHIADDAREVRLAHAVLRPGGTLLVFGPGLEWLYSELDYKAGHYRRYDIDDLRRLVEAAGLEVVSAGYFDVLGVVPYALVYKLARHAAISGSTMWGYDRVVVPASRLLQRVVAQPPVGKNVLLVARKPP